MPLTKIPTLFDLTATFYTDLSSICIHLRYPDLIFFSFFDPTQLDANKTRFDFNLCLPSPPWPHLLVLRSDLAQSVFAFTTPTSSSPSSIRPSLTPTRPDSTSIWLRLHHPTSYSPRIPLNLLTSSFSPYWDRPNLMPIRPILTLISNPTSPGLC